MWRAYIETLKVLEKRKAGTEPQLKDATKPTTKQHLAVIRMLFDWLVTSQVVATNPAHEVRGPKHVIETGKYSAGRRLGAYAS
jgi:site-specific recombinase XerC